MNIQNVRSGGTNGLGSPSSLRANNNLLLSNAENGGTLANNLSNGNGELGTDFASLLNRPEVGLKDDSLASKGPDDTKLRETFNDFVGQTFFGQLLSSMRSTQGEAAYFNGGRAEKIFQGQLDQVLSEELSESSASQIADPMFKLFQANRPQ